MEAKYREYELRLPDEFLLLMISDGILETFEEKNLEKKLAYLDKLVNNLDIHIADIMKKLSLDNDTPITDDITFLMVKRRVNNG
jgi:serine phosphatase RsbU (regulator of sigma subunit)